MKAFTKKPKALTSDDFGEIRAAIDLPTQPNRDIFDFLQGRSPRYPVHNIEGIPVNLEGVMYRSPTGRYQLELRVGNQVYRVASIQPGKSTENIAALMTKVSPSPSHIAMQQKHSAAQKLVDDIQAENNRWHREAAIKLREQREANERQRRAAAASR